MRGFYSRLSAELWLRKHATGVCYCLLHGRVRGFDPTDGRLFVIAEIDATPMW